MWSVTVYLSLVVRLISPMDKFNGEFNVTRKSGKAARWYNVTKNCSLVKSTHAYILNSVQFCLFSVLDHLPEESEMLACKFVADASYYRAEVLGFGQNCVKVICADCATEDRQKPICDSLKKVRLNQSICWVCYLSFCVRILQRFFEGEGAGHLPPHSIAADDAGHSAVL